MQECEKSVIISAEEQGAKECEGISIWWLGFWILVKECCHE